MKQKKDELLDLWDDDTWMDDKIEEHESVIHKCGYDDADKIDKYNLAISYELFMKD